MNFLSYGFYFSGSWNIIEHFEIKLVDLLFSPIQIGLENLPVCGESGHTIPLPKLYVQCDFNSSLKRMDILSVSKVVEGLDIEITLWG